MDAIVLKPHFEKNQSQLSATVSTATRRHWAVSPNVVMEKNRDMQTWGDTAECYQMVTALAVLSAQANSRVQCRSGFALSRGARLPLAEPNET